MPGSLLLYATFFRLVAFYYEISMEYIDEQLGQFQYEAPRAMWTTHFCEPDRTLLSAFHDCSVFRNVGLVVFPVLSVFNFVCHLAAGFDLFDLHNS